LVLILEKVTTPIVPVIIGDEDKTYEMCGSLEELGVLLTL